MEDETPLLPSRGVIEEDEQSEAVDPDFADQVALSSYGLGMSDFFVCSAYSRIPPHARPVFSGRVFLFVWSALFVKPMCCVVLYFYCCAAGTYRALVTAVPCVVTYYLTLAIRGGMLYANIKRDRLPLTAPVYWTLATFLAAAGVASTAVAACETFEDRSLFAYVETVQSMWSDDPTRKRSIALVPATVASLWVMAADSVTAAANFFLARFWTRAILNTRVVF
ncbi:envelope protein UL20 [Saimiriine alphaherpesvirus 1]|uniref:UL20 n=1 Tax=Saimiriine herpesvirus 1 (strain MV-5-4-PSL) TaxID=10353 RepID=Q8V1P1_SHV1|nr:envelope protein UL20 [Saimiriine alphaherpesvirus 1]AAL67780.1 UL20 [Saimiriine alphaherpesvirus 1]ADO13808.1 envelope protein UL20 [Saimiriine alphaherpesvirus 1]